jgi:hypothetical protein
MSLVWDWSLPATEKLVALKLADCADDQGRNAWPAVATIAADCGLSRRGTQEVLRRLVTRGCIEVQADATNRKSTTYRILLLAQVPGPGRDGTPGSSAVGGEVAAPLGAQHVHPEGRTTCAGGAQQVRGGGAPRAPLGAHHVRPIRPTTVLDPSSDPSRARECGRRPHPLDGPIVLTPKLLELLDELRLVYPRKDGSPLDTDRAWRALNLTPEQARFVIAHVRMRVAAGWVREVGGERFLPMLWRFLDGRRWEERAPAVASSASVGLDGMRSVRCCDVCGEELEGRVVGGRPQFPPCPRCASARAAAGSGEAVEEPHA